ncbi:hypothetical protein H072_4038 [Dactylellina haptotyla CBS 200.50]|uniref:CHAT domain-containing protein n=1 Tax=Dactylellina haptotyla (strain CBS 200.50) TaxID=1284197 RepID=S8BRC0_DACHA|nr:hypothetical protein H072_4038 [Dactylellina haptotyla CBS 200.50]
MDRTMPIPFRVDPDMVELVEQLEFEDLKDLAKIYKEPTNDTQIELYIYICHAIFERSQLGRYLETATQQAIGWEEVKRHRKEDASHCSEIQMGLSFKLMVPIGQGQKENFGAGYRYGLTTIMSLPPQHPNRIGMENLRGRKLSASSPEKISIETLEAMMPMNEAALDFGGLSEQNRVIMLYNIADCHNKIYKANGSLEHLSKSIDALDRIEKNHGSDYHRFEVLRTLNNHLARRSIDTGSILDIDRAIRISDIITIIADENDASLAIDGEALRKANFLDIKEQLLERPVRESIKSIINKFGEILDSGDINKAIEFQKRATKSIPQAHSLRQHVRLDRLLLDHYVKHGNVGNVNQAIEILSIAKAGESDDEPLVEMIQGLGILLYVRYTLTGQMEDLDQAVLLIQESLELIPSSNPRFPQLTMFLHVLGVKYTETEAFEDLKNLETVAEKITSSPDMDAAEASLLWGQMYSFRYRVTGDLEDCNNVIEILTPLLDIEELDKIISIPARNLLAGMHGSRYSRTGNMESLEQQLELTTYLKEDFEAGAKGRSSAFRSCFHLLNHKAVFEKYKQSGFIEDLDKAHEIIQAAWDDPNNTGPFHLIMGGSLARILEIKGQWDDASKVLEESVKHLLVITPRSLKNTDKQGVIGQHFGLASHAARLFLWAGKTPLEALQILELGRGIVTSLMLEIRTDISGLEAAYPDLASEFLSLRQVLDSPMSETSKSSLMLGSGLIPQETEKKKRRDAEKRLVEVMKEIHSKNGFERFLLPHTSEQLMAAAEGGPIAIINTEERECHAFIVEKSRIRAIKLPNLRQGEIVAKAALLRGTEESEIWEVLEWLWDAVAQPILNALGFTSKPIGKLNEWPRLRWVPTGSLSQLPLHAAGRHLKDSDETVLDRVISSYSLSIKTLIYGRERKDFDLKASNDALLISMSKTPGHSSLYFAGKEIEVLEELCPALGLEIKKPPRQRDEILSSLSTCGIFHFAGHGSFNRSDPSRSCLLLDDWQTDPLTVSKLWEYKIQNNPPFLAYLSACSTGANDELKFSDEGINLISAYQLAGFRHVIGTLWEVDDLYCVKIAKRIYKTIRDEGGLKDENVSLALHTALTSLRSKSLANSSIRKARGHSGFLKMVDDLETETSNMQSGAKSVGGDFGSSDHTKFTETIKGDQNITGGETRNAKTVDLSELNFHWVPYVHFGV